jgi:hypothetical protein
LSLVLYTGAHANTTGLDIPAASGEPEAWLVTYAPGELYWQRYGHNAIWIRDWQAGINHSFNFGYFDFEQDDFLLRFARGRMMYFSVAQPVEREFEQYRAEDRTIRIQRLDLDAAAITALRDELLQQIQPETRDYRYDYYLSNCSTRVRDALDEAWGGALAAATRTAPAGQNFRQHTRRSSAPDFWYYLALETGLGLPVDRPVSRWKEMFLPGVVADVLAGWEVNGRPAVINDHIVYRGSAEQPADTAGPVWWRYLAFSVVISILLALLAPRMGPALSGGLSMAWLLLLASGGLVILWLWLFTDHSVVRPNFNLLLLNPLFMIGLWPAARRLSAVLITFGVLLGLVLQAWPDGQYFADVVAFIAPFSLVVAGWLWSQGNPARPGKN